MERSQLSQDLDILRRSLGPLPEGAARPAFVVVSGLPGAGKSFFSRRLAEKAPFYILQSDVLRKALFEFPEYSLEESARLFAACHSLIEELLSRGIPIIFDATNLSERYRERLYRIADKTGAKLVLVQVEAPLVVVHQRLQQRCAGSSPEDRSDAGLDVYRRMKSRVDRIPRNHLVVDTSRDITPVIEKILRLISR